MKSKSKDVINDTRIHTAIKYAFLISKNIHFMQIDNDVKDGGVVLFGKVKVPKWPKKLCGSLCQQKE